MLQGNEAVTYFVRKGPFLLLGSRNTSACPALSGLLIPQHTDSAWSRAANPVRPWAPTRVKRELREAGEEP